MSLTVAVSFAIAILVSRPISPISGSIASVSVSTTTAIPFADGLVIIAFDVPGFRGNVLHFCVFSAHPNTLDFSAEVEDGRNSKNSRPDKSSAKAVDSAAVRLFDALSRTPEYLRNTLKASS